MKIIDHVVVSWPVGERQVSEGTSALFLVTDEGDLDRLGERFHGAHMKLVDTNLTAEERKLLLETFGDH